MPNLSFRDQHDSSTDLHLQQKEQTTQPSVTVS